MSERCRETGTNRHLASNHSGRHDGGMTHHKGPQTLGKAHPKAEESASLPPSLVDPVARAVGHKAQRAESASLPPSLVDVALVGAPACAAVGAMSLSWWHAEVAAGRAPAPVIRAPRCTRWRLADVAEFWRQRAEQADPSAASAVTAQARRASAAAGQRRKQRHQAGA